MAPKAKIKSPLSRKATLVTLNISTWSARRLDRKVTDEVNKQHNAKADAGRYNKLLIPAEHMKRITQCVSAARATHYQMTMPWNDDGPRVLPNTLYNKYTEAMREHTREMEAAVTEFLKVYPKLKAEAPARLNGMYNAADYPEPHVINKKFSMAIDVNTMPDAADFRSDLDPDTEADIRAEIEKTTEATETRLAHDTKDRIVDVVGKMATALASYGDEIEDSDRTRSFKDTLVGNVRDLADLLPAFNLNGDPELAKIADRIKRELCVEEAKALRENDDARHTVQKSAESILEDVSRFLA